MFEAILDKKLNADRGFIKPKRKPPEELERLKRENFERAAPGLENPDEVKQMLGLAYGGMATPKRGLVDEPGSYAGKEGYASGTLPPTQEARKKFKGKKFISVPDPSYSDGRRRVMTPEYKAFVEKLQAKPNPAEIRIKEGYKIAKAKLPKGTFPSVEQIREAVPGVKPSLDTVYSYTEKNKLKLSQPRGGTIASIIEAYEKVSDSGDRLITKNIANKLPKNIKTKWKTPELLKSYVGEILNQYDLPFEKSDLMHTTRSRTKAGKTTTAQAKIENIVDSDTLAKLKADIKKYKSGTIVGPQQTMKISDFKKYFPEGTSDVVVSRQVNRLGNEMGLKFKKISKPEELEARKLKEQIKKVGDPKGIAKKMKGTKEMPLHHMRAKGFVIDGQIKAISPSLDDLTYIDVVTNSERLQNFERVRNNLANELLELKETKPKGWKRRVKEINALARRESNKIPKNLRGLLYFETLDEAGNLKPIGGNPYRALGKRKPGADIPFDSKKTSSALQELMSRKGSLVDPTLLAKAGYEEFLKPTAKFAGKVLTSKPAVVLSNPSTQALLSYNLLKENPSDPFGYAALTGMGASAKLVGDKIKTPFLQKALTLGAGPARVAKLARFTTPFGIAATGVASLVNVAREAQKEFDALSPEEQKEYLAEQEQFAEDVNRDEFLSYAGGGIVGIRRPSAIPPEKGPQSQGLDYLRYYGT